MINRTVEKLRTLPRSYYLFAVGAVLASIVLLTIAAVLFVHVIDDNPRFTADQFEVQGGSHAIAMTTALIDREVNQHNWTPNDPFFYPGAWLTRMPAYQRGIISALARFAMSLSDQVARARGSSAMDPDIQKALGLLNYPPNVWFYDTSVSYLPTASSEAQYNAGKDALESYNHRVANGAAYFERRSDNLLETLDRMASDLGSSSALIDTHVNTRAALAFGSNATLFYETKGKMYAYYLLMRALGEDFADVIKEKQLQSVWEQTLHSLQTGASLKNFLVMNAAPDNALLPSHLTAQGFYLMRSRMQIREITDILLK